MSMDYVETAPSNNQTAASGRINDK